MRAKINFSVSCRKLSNKIKPVVKRLAKGAAVICVSLAVNSLSAVANETYNKAGVVAKSAKSAKSSSKMAKRAAEIGSAIFVCTNAGLGAEDAIVTSTLSKPYKLVIFGFVFVCGFLCGKGLCEAD